MPISLDKAIDCFIGFMADQVAQIPKLGDRFLGYAALGSLKSNPEILAGRVQPWLEMSGMLSNGQLDLAAAKAALEMAFANVPKVSYFGFSFTDEDAKALLAKLRGLASADTEAD